MGPRRHEQIAGGPASVSDVGQAPGRDPDEWTRAEEVELRRILASGSGPQWQRYLRKAQQAGRTLPLKEYALGPFAEEFAGAEDPASE
jgi:hypothetical protein